MEERTTMKGLTKCSVPRCSGSVNGYSNLCDNHRVNSAGGTPIISASDRLTRNTRSAWSCTTMKSVIASKISIQWRFACSIRVPGPIASGF